MTHFFADRGYSTAAIGKLHCVDENCKHGPVHRVNVVPHSARLTRQAARASPKQPDNRSVGKPPILMVRIDRWTLNDRSWERSELFNLETGPGEFQIAIGYAPTPASSGSPHGSPFQQTNGPDAARRGLLCRRLVNPIQVETGHANESQVPRSEGVPSGAL